MQFYVSGDMVFDELIGSDWMFSGNDVVLFLFVSGCSVCVLLSCLHLHPSACWLQYLLHEKQ